MGEIETTFSFLLNEVSVDRGVVCAKNMEVIEVGSYMADIPFRMWVKVGYEINYGIRKRY